MLTRGLTNKLPVMLNIRDIPKGVHTVEKKRRTVSTIRSTTNLHTHTPPNRPPPPSLHILKQELIQAETSGTLIHSRDDWTHSGP